MGDQLAEYVSSQNDVFADANALREWETAINQTGINERCCYSMALYNTRETQTLSLMSKESRSMLNRLTTRLHEHVFTVHRLIMIVYAPTLLKDTDGTISIMLYHQATGQSIDVVKEHSVGQAATFVARWPRGIPVTQKGLSLIASTNNIGVLAGAHVGTLHPFWEDKLQRQTIFEKQRATLTYLLSEQEPAFYIKDAKVLKAAMRSKISLGGVGNDVIITHPLSLTLDRVKQHQPKQAQIEYQTNTADQELLAAMERLGVHPRHTNTQLEIGGSSGPQVVENIVIGSVPLPDVYIAPPVNHTTATVPYRPPKVAPRGS